MKKLLRLFILLITISTVNVKASSLQVSPDSLSIKQGNIVGLKITADNCAGRVDISISDSAVATISSTSLFLDNSTETIMVTGINAGNASITVNITDVTGYDLKAITGVKTIPVYVYEPDPSTEQTPRRNQVNPKTDENELITSEGILGITKFEIVGYDISFDEDKREYKIDIDEQLGKVYVVVEGEGLTVEGNKEVNIKEKNDFTVTVSKGNIKKDYKIVLNRIRRKEGITSAKENEKLINLPFIITLCLLVMIIGYNIINIIKKQKHNNIHIIKDDEVL